MSVCTKCGEGEARKGGSLCNGCIATYMRSYRAANGQRATKDRAFRRGFEACRSAAIEVFDRIGPRGMTGYTAAAIMRESIVTAPVKDTVTQHCDR